MTDDNTIVIEENVEVVEEITEESLSDLSDEEKQMATDLGLVEKPEEVEEKPEEEVEEEVVVEDEVKEEIEVEEETEADKVESLTKKEKGFYFEMKDARQSAKDAKNERDLLKVKVEAFEKQLKSLEDKRVVSESDDIGDIDKQISEIIEGDSDDIITRADLVKLEELKQKRNEVLETKRTESHASDQAKQKELIQRLNSIEKNAKEEDPEFDSKVLLAQEVMNNDTSGVYGLAFQKAIMQNDGGKEVVDLINKISSLSSTEEIEVKEEKSDTDVAKVIKNSKRKSSASLGGVSRRTLSEDDLTLDDASKLSQTQWDKLKPKTKRRLLGG